jgi:hypothetical protein
VVFDGHREDDDDPLVYVTEDFGKTWTSLRSNLPSGSTRCLREDMLNQNLLFVGTEFAVWVSIDRGHSWTKLNNNLPTVAVHDFAIHPTAGEMVAATHGRSLWILDITPLRQMSAELAKAKAHLFQPNTAVRWRIEPSRGGTNRRFVGQNPSPGAQIYYSLTKKADKISLTVVDYTGKTVRELRATGDAGLHKVAWDLRVPSARRGRGGAGGAPAGAGAELGSGRAGRGQRGGRGGQARGQTAPGQPAAGEAAAQPAGGGRGAGGRGGFGRGGGGQPVPPGTYRIVLTVDGEQFTQPLRAEAESASADNIIASDEDEDDPDR